MLILAKLISKQSKLEEEKVLPVNWKLVPAWLMELLNI